MLYQGDAGLEEVADLEVVAAAFGLRPDWDIEAENKDQEEEETECYPDNWHVLELFRALTTQWNLSSHGRLIGLRYEALPVVMDLLGIPRRKRPYVFWALSVMESAVMEVLNKRRE